MTERKKCGPKSGSSDPRITEARRLRRLGATDERLLELGYNRREIARSFIPNSVSIHKRCRACGCLAIVDEDRVCMHCEMVARMKREERERSEPKQTKRVEVQLSFDHPAILRSGK